MNPRDHKKPQKNEGDSKNGKKSLRVITLRVPEETFNDLKRMRKETGRSVQSVLLAALHGGPPLILAPDALLWLENRSREHKIPTHNFLDRCIYKVMQYERTTGRSWAHPVNPK